MDTTGLSKRAFNALSKEYPDGILEVTNFTRSELLRIPNLGVVTVDEIEAWLLSFGLKLQPPEDWRAVKAFQKAWEEAVEEDERRDWRKELDGRRCPCCGRVNPKASVHTT